MYPTCVPVAAALMRPPALPGGFRSTMLAAVPVHTAGWLSTTGVKYPNCWFPSIPSASDRIAPLVAWTRRYFPQVSTEHCVPWSGLRPMTPNMMPYIGQGHHQSVFYNTGHGHLGWTLSAATADMITNQIGIKLPLAA
jgi:glycine/D-amino acid oxidase-like deaminating enzyme